MTTNRKYDSWFQEEKANIPNILKAFWEKRVKNRSKNNNPANDLSIERFKLFVQCSYEEYCEAKKIWSKENKHLFIEEFNAQFEKAFHAENDVETFQNFFGEWFTLSDAMAVLRNHLPDRVQKEVEVVEIEKDDIDKLNGYLAGQQPEFAPVSASVALWNAKSKNPPYIAQSEDIVSNALFQMHSVMKIFTAVLVLKMIEADLIPMDDIKKPMGESKFFRDFIESLPDQFKKQFQPQLEKISLHQLMMHQAGFGDYYEHINSYIKMENPQAYQLAIIESRERNEQLLITDISDLLQFSEDKLYPLGCTVLTLSYEPTENNLKHLPIQENAAFICCDNKLFYVNKEKQKCTVIDLNLPKLDEFKSKLKPGPLPRKLIDSELDIIKNIVGGDIHEREHYSNVGLTLVGMVAQYAANQAQAIEKKTFNDTLMQFFIDNNIPINTEDFQQCMPTHLLHLPSTHSNRERYRYNQKDYADQAAPYIVAGPAGYYWTSTYNLAVFGKWLFDECNQNPTFKNLLEEYGKEFYKNGCISHSGTLMKSSSAFLSVNLNTGNIIAVLCDQSDIEGTALEFRLKQHIFSANNPHYAKIFSTSKSEKTSITTEATAINANNIDLPKKRDS